MKLSAVKMDPVNEFTRILLGKRSLPTEIRSSANAEIRETSLKPCRDGQNYDCPGFIIG